MAKIDLSGLSLEELSDLIEEATKLRSGKIEAKRQELHRQLAELDAIGSPAKRVVSGGRPPVKPKYQSKKDPSLTWAGRGAQPKWLSAEMQETGKPLDYFLVGNG
jgi:DNA-binding protein H-NS